MDEKRTTQALKQILGQCGTGILKEKRRFGAYLEDLLPGGAYAAERRLFQYALDSDALPLLLRNQAFTAESFQRAVERLQKDIYVNEGAAWFVVRCVVTARDGVLEEAGGPESPKPPAGKREILPYGTTEIPSRKFENRTDLTGVTIPDSVTKIGVNTFFNCNNLAEIVLPDSVKSIASSAFANCEKLARVVLPRRVTTIGINAFTHCFRLASIEIPGSLTEINSDTFSFCKGLTSVTIQNGVKRIDYLAFSYCESLRSITIPNSVKYIDNYAFSGCANLTDVSLPRGCEVKDNAFERCPKVKITRR